MRVAVVASAQIFGGFQNLPPPQSLDFSAFFGLSHLFPPRLSISVIFDTDLVTSHPATYTPTAKWDATGGKILKDLEAMIRMLTKRGLRASDLVCSPDVADTIINDAAVQKLLDNRRIEIGNVEPELLPDGAAIVARLNVLGRIISVISYDLTYTDDEGNDKLYIPSGKCVLTAPGAGRTAYGAVSQVEQSDGEFHTYAGRRVPKYVSSAEGNSRTLTISSRPLMIPNNKNPFIVADVLTD